MEGAKMWKIAGRSEIGTSHQAKGLPCQDAWGFKNANEEGKRILIALSDGAGFASKAEIASQLAVETALNAMATCEPPLDQIQEDQVANWIDEVYAAIAKESKANNLNINDYSCTLLGALIEGNSAYFWQLGDGAWLVKTCSGIEVATWPSSGDYINQTTFITSKDARKKWTPAYYREIQSFVGITDGIEHICLDYPNQKAYEPFVSKLLSGLSLAKPESVEREIKTLLSSDLINHRTDDDKTMILGWQHLV